LCSSSGSSAFHELKRTAAGRDNLRRVVDECSTSATMRYNPACYECPLGRLEQGKAFKLGDAKKTKLAPLGDPDFQPLWAKIGEI
jgi:hypothetical protein